MSGSIASLRGEQLTSCLARVYIRDLIREPSSDPVSGLARESDP